MPIAVIFYDVENLGVLFVVQFVHVMWLRGRWVMSLFEAHITDSCSVHLGLETKTNQNSENEF